jgi:hypothetical protein
VAERLIEEGLRIEAFPGIVFRSEPTHAGRFAGISDDQVFARAQEDGRAVVTDNIADYEQARRDWESN